MITDSKTIYRSLRFIEQILSLGSRSSSLSCSRLLGLLLPGPGRGLLVLLVSASRLLSVSTSVSMVRGRDWTPEWQTCVVAASPAHAGETRIMWCRSPEQSSYSRSCFIYFYLHILTFNCCNCFTRIL